MNNELQISRIISLQQADSQAARQGDRTAAFGLTARMPVSRTVDPTVEAEYFAGFSMKNRNRSCQSAASFVWQAQTTLWEKTPVDLSVRCDFDVASVKIALSQMTHVPVSPRGGCVASAAAALGSVIP